MPRLSGSARNRPLPLPAREKGRTPANGLPEGLSENTPDTSADVSPQITVEIPAQLDRLRAHIRKLEGFGHGFEKGGSGKSHRPVLPFGIAAIDSHLPGGGLVRGALHDVFADDAGIATAFCALLAGRLAQPSGENDIPRNSGKILWCERPWTLDAGALYGPALMTFGIDPAQLILVRARRDADVLWAMEEGLRCNRLAAVIGEIAGMSLTASRRLQLAAEESGVTALTLRPRADKPAPSAAATRWRLDAVAHDDVKTTETAPPGLGASRWQAELFRCRGGASASWMMEWNDETGDFSVAALVRNRPPVPSAAGLAG